MKKYNFYAGPSILPAEILNEAAKAVQNLEGTGLSILEISHRSPAFTAIIQEAQELVLELTGLQGKGYKVLFLQGGASLQFLMVAQNLMRTKAAYLNTGRWSSSAIQEAQLFGEVIEVASSADKNFTYIPTDYSIAEDIDYFHCTSNNTVAGTQIKEFPTLQAPLVCDMSSDLFSRMLDYSKFGLIYAGAQKNLGPAGTTLVIIKESILGKVNRQIPTMLDYKTHLAKKSVFNTPSVYAIYVSLLTLRALKEQGGMAAIEKKNKKKATLFYQALDALPAFEGIVEAAARSLMNITFKLTDSSRQEEFDNTWQKAGFVGLKGHRSVGGYRASLYNAQPLENVERLIDLLNKF